MRLTLRTLLAWMDGLLPPDEARELGSRVQASGAARHLAERIRAAVARGPLPAIDTDPNIVAEYLDNVLASEQLVPFERDCLESDAALAEVAGCHALLAEVLREQPAPRLEEPPSPLGEPAVVATRPHAPPRPPAPTTAWFSLLAAVLLLVTLVGVLGWSLMRPGRGRPPAAAAPAVAEATAEPEPVAAVAVETRRSPAADHALPKPDRPEPVAIAANAAQPASTQPMPPQSVPPQSVPPEPPPGPAAPPAAAAAPLVPATVVVEPRVPFGDALAIVAPPSIPAPGAPVPSPAATTPAPEPAPEPDAAARDGVGPLVTGGPAVLRRVDGGDAPTWQAVTVGQRFESPASLIAPACGRPQITLDDFRFAVSPGTQFSLASDADGTPRLTIGFGSVVVATDRVDARIGVTAGDLAGTATIGPAGPLAVDVQLGRDPGGDPEAEATRRMARIISVSAPVTWRPTSADGGVADPPLTGVRGAEVIPARAELAWTSDEPAAADLRTLAEVPAWINGASDRIDRTAAEALAARFAAGDPAAVALRDLVAVGRAETRIAAAATLALVGEYDEAARLLCGELPGDELREGQWQALEAAVVPLALARGPRAAAALAEALAAHAPAGRGADVIRFAGGMSDAELAAGGDAALVAALDAPQLVVRRYACKNLIEITAATGVDRLRYRPDRPESLRREGVVWWQAQLAQGRIRHAHAVGSAPRP